MDDDGNLAGFDEAHRALMRPLRQLIFDTAAETGRAGPLTESLKWGEPSYAPLKKGIGSSVRLAPRKDGNVSMNFICHTGLVDQFRELYTGKLAFEGNRTIVVNPAQPLPVDELRHCIGLALTFRLNKR